MAGDAPQGVTEPVLHHDTLVGLLSDGLRYEFGNGLTVTISEEYRTNIRVLYISECRAVLLLLWDGLLVPFDQVILIVRDRGEADNAELAVCAHRLSIHVKIRLFVSNEVALLNEVL